MSSLATNTVKYYPVDNGDQSLITLEDKTTILIDCNIRECAKGDNDEDMYDAHEDLLNSISRDSNGVPFIDVFILTHGDEDHCRGFEKNFYQGDPSKYSKTDKENKLIRVDAMWFSPMIAEKWKNTDEEAYQKEAERRLELHRKHDAKRNDPGNRIRIIGYDGNKKYDDLDKMRSTPGDVVERFNDRDQEKFSIFIHSPFKEHLTEDGPDKKNSTSIVFQARWKENKTDTDFSALFMFGGDADYAAWEKILSATKDSGKDVSQRALDWDVFLAPHHCSWSYFNKRPQASFPEPLQPSLDILDYRRGDNPKVVASCREIVLKKPNPPHKAAKDQYVDKVGSANFLNTSTHEVKNGIPQPIIFEITSQGPTKSKLVEGSARVAGAGATSTIKKPSEYGNGLQ